MKSEELRLWIKDAEMMQYRAEHEALAMDGANYMNFEDWIVADRVERLCKFILLIRGEKTE